jgi:hypothetical protein
LNSLLCKSTAWTWSLVYQQAFDALKHAPSIAPVLAIPDFTKPFQIICDASITGIGTILIQGRPIAFGSHKLSELEV